jgi:esterase/lipase superfamily enzyme
MASTPLLPWRRSAISVVLIAAASRLSGQEPGKLLQELRVQVPASQTSRSPVIKMKTGETIEVQPEKGPDGTPLVDIYVHDDDKKLIARDDPDSASPTFRWVCRATGGYYVLLRNVGERSGSVAIKRYAQGDQARAEQPAKNFARVRVFYATDREKAKPGESLAYFSGEPTAGNKLTYGSCEISIPRPGTHTMGELEGPSILKLEFRPDPEKHILLLPETLKDLARNDFLKGIGDRVSEAPEHEALVFVHGFDNSFEDAARRAGQISYDLGFTGATILYSWPSHGKRDPLSYNKDGRNAELSVVALANLLDDLRRNSGARTIHLVAHSMGNRVLTKALDRLVADKRETPRFRQVILMAPDIDAGLFLQLAASFRQAADHVTLYASSLDVALKASMEIAGYPRAGQGGKGIVVVKGIDTIDASNVDTSMLGAFHQYYADSRMILSDLFQLIRGSPPDKRFGLHPAQSDGGPYWMFRP